MAATKTICHMQEFHLVDETVSAYLEWFEVFIFVNAIEEDKFVLTLLTVVGLAYYSLLCGIASLEIPKNESLS